MTEGSEDINVVEGFVGASVFVIGLSRPIALERPRGSLGAKAGATDGTNEKLAYHEAL